MNLSYVADPYINTIYQRQLDSLPDGNFYAKDGLVLPYRIDPHTFTLTTEHIGLVHRVESSDGTTIRTIIPDSETVTLKLVLEKGQYDIQVKALDATTQTMVDLAVLPIIISEIGTILYALSETLVGEWVNSIDLYNYLVSGYQLLIFESSLSMDIRNLLPQEYNSKLMALKSLMRIAVTGSSSEGIEAFFQAACGMNPPKIVRFMNSQELLSRRVEDTPLETTTQDAKVWFPSSAMGRRAVLTRLVNNFPEKFAAPLTAGNEFLIIDRAEHREVARQPSDLSMFMTIKDPDSFDMLTELGIEGLGDISLSTETDSFYVVPNYTWRDWNDYHYWFNGYTPSDVAKYGDQRWFTDPNGQFDRRRFIYAIPDLPETRLDRITNVEDDTNTVPFKWADTLTSEANNLQPPQAHTRWEFQAIDNMQVGIGNTADDNVRLDVSVGRTGVRLISDLPFSPDSSGYFPPDFEQGMTASAFAWDISEATLDPWPDPYIPSDSETVVSVIVFPYFSRPTQPGSRNNYDYPSHYSEEELQEFNELGTAFSPELWLSYQQMTPMAEGMYNNVRGIPDSWLHDYQLLSLGFFESEINPFMWEGQGNSGRIGCFDIAQASDIVNGGYFQGRSARTLQVGLFRLPDGGFIQAFAFNVGQERTPPRFNEIPAYTQGTASVMVADTYQSDIVLGMGSGSYVLTPTGNNGLLQVTWPADGWYVIGFHMQSPPPNCSLRVVTHNAGLEWLHLLNPLGATEPTVQLNLGDVELHRED